MLTRMEQARAKRAIKALQELQLVFIDRAGNYLIETDEIWRPATLEVESGHEQEAQMLCAALQARLQDNGLSISSRRMAAWLPVARDIVTKDQRNPQEAAAIIEWACGHDFWRAHIQGMRKVREKYDTLRMQRERPETKADRIDQSVLRMGMSA